MTRLDRLNALILHFSIEYDDDPEIEENLDKFLSGEEPIGRFAAITQGPSHFFIYPRFNTFKAAAGRAEEFILDDIYAERPIAIIDLDSGEGFIPALPSVKWVQNNSVAGFAGVVEPE